MKMLQTKHQTPTSVAKLAERFSGATGRSALRVSLQIFAGLLLLTAVGATASSAGPEFVREVRPILQKHCYSCHGAGKQKSSLRLDINSEAFKGGEAYGPSIIAGKPQESPLIQFVGDPDADLQMPPDSRLSPAEIATLTQWVKQGAVWPADADLAKLVDKADHWSFKPLTHPSPPTPSDTSWPRGAIDQFILSSLENAGLTPAPPADRVTWLRRVTFDLTGLPPTPSQVDAFVNDRRSDAFERVVDELLRSPRYGERWAQHWLDVVRYADTHGFEVNTERKNAWPYRDYVVAAFNSDTPYNQFVQEQLAGDALQQDAATGFLVTAAVLLPGQIGKDAESRRLARQDSLAEILINTGEAFLGLSIGCARCHDHKFDPISQKDYYAMQAFFSGVRYGDRPVDTPAAQAAKEEAQQHKHRIAQIDRRLANFEPLAQPKAEEPALRSSINPQQNIDRFPPVVASQVRFTILKTNNREPCLDELEVFDDQGRNVALATAGTTAKSSGDYPPNQRHKLKHINDGVYGNDRSWISNQQGQGQMELSFKTPQKIDRVVWGRDRAGKYDDRLALEYTIEIKDQQGEWVLVADATDRQPFDPKQKQPLPLSTAELSQEETQQITELQAEKKKLQSLIAEAAQRQLAYAGQFVMPMATHLLFRGDPEQPRDKMAPAVITALGDAKLPEDAAEQDRRIALAQWITQPSNPLTARVMVNRIWQGHFGIGLVETASDFGRNGAKPTHPALLDWLASEFISTGWSIKKMHRQIVLSATYRQSSRIDPAAQEQDADARLLWRYPPRRLEAEAIRDSMLAVSGRLNLQSGGPGFNLFRSRGGLNGFPPVESFEVDGRRRMIYAHKVRMEREIVFGAFDCPDAGQSMARRRQSTTPIQALNLFNSRFTLEEATALAQRVASESGDDPADQIRRAYRLCLSREASPAEVADAAPLVREHGLAALCRVLFNCNEFLFLP